MERIAMSQQERDSVDWMKRAGDGQVTQKWVAETMGVSAGTSRDVTPILKLPYVRGSA